VAGSKIKVVYVFKLTILLFVEWTRDSRNLSG
jgi:hypothetical protein